MTVFLALMKQQAKLACIFMMTLTLGAGIAMADEPHPPQSLEESLAAEFKCPDDAKDSSHGIEPGPNVVVRWCEVQKNGWPVYHGPLLRWYPGKQVRAREYYIKGAAAGLWVTYHQSGKMAALGEWKDGHKTGLWKYWNDASGLRNEVTYTGESNHQTVYYPSGSKKSDGTFISSGKIGKWIYWDENGKEKASCDFGRGLHEISGDGCKIIAEELEPKGFSPPVQSAAVAKDGSFELSVGADIFHSLAPEGWVTDADVAKQQDVPVVFYLKGKKWQEPGPNMYIRVFFKEGRTFENTIKDDSADVEANVAGYHAEAGEEGTLQGGHKYTTRLITYQPLHKTDSPFAVVASNTFHEQVVYIDATDKIVLFIALVADSADELKQYSPAQMAVIKSMRVK
jgi:hypothetical protein